MQQDHVEAHFYRACGIVLRPVHEQGPLSRYGKHVRPCADRAYEVARVSCGPAFIASARRRHRASTLASTERAGTQSRQIIRRAQRERLCDRWYVFAGIAAIATVVCLAVELLVAQPLDAYLVGAIAVSTLWACHSVLTTADGLAARRAGILGEEWTVMELQRLPRGDWRFVNHVMLERGDVDHAVLGPGGFFAVDSKWRSEWSEVDLSRVAAACHEQARKLHSRLGVRMPRVSPVIVMWGPRVADTYPHVFERDGVTFCPGKLLVGHLRGLPTSIDTGTIETAFAALDRYVEKRDVGEQEERGESLRSISDQFNDLLFAGLAAGASLFAVALVSSIPPGGVWSIATAAALAVAGGAARIRWSSSPTAQRITTAVITTGAGLAALFLAALVVDILR
jgi:hypothetical protein